MGILHLPELVLRGREVLLRPLTLDDIPGLAAASGESREHYHYNPVPDGLQRTMAYVEHALQSKAHGQRYPFTIIWRDRVVGTTSYSEYQPWQWFSPSEHQRTDFPMSL